VTLKQVQSLVLWLRRERISYTTLSAGGVTLDGVIDGKLADGAPEAKPEPRQTMYARFAGELGKQPQVRPSERVPEEAMDD